MILRCNSKGIYSWDTSSIMAHQIMINPGGMFVQTRFGVDGSIKQWDYNGRKYSCARFYQKSLCWSKELHKSRMREYL